MIAYCRSATSPADPSRTGYTFTGWDKCFSSITGNMTVTAQYTINSYTLTFMDDDQITPIASIPPITQNYGTIVTTQVNPEKLGHAFMGRRQREPADSSLHHACRK